MLTQGDTIRALDRGHVTYLMHTPEELVIQFARICYAGASKGEEADRKLIEYLYKNKHTSPFEAPKIYFNIKMPIFVMRQYVRHRMQNLNEVSARYTELPNDFFLPEKWRAQDTKNRQGSVIQSEWDGLVTFEDPIAGSIRITQHDIFTRKLAEHCDRAYALYEEYLEAGVAREMARMVLPLNIYTEIMCCWDLKNLLHFVSLREDSHAQSEIQEYAKAMKIFLNQCYPMIMGAYEKYKFIVKEQTDFTCRKGHAEYEQIGNTIRCKVCGESAPI